MLAPADGDRFVLEAILAESFANTVESLASVVRHLPVSDNIFFPLNSYFSWDQARQKVLERGAAECGLRLRFVLLYLAHFEANLAIGEPADSTFDRIAETSGCAGDTSNIAREIAAQGFRLNAGFRENTTPAYFELLGYSGEYRNLARSAWLGQTQNRNFVCELIDRFHHVADGVLAPGV